MATASAWAGDEGSNREPRPCNVIPPPENTHAGNYWPGGRVPFEFDANVSAGNRAEVLLALGEIENVCSVDFFPRTNEVNYIHVQSSTGNNSSIGMIGGEQIVNIFNFNFRFIMVHEFCHALSFFHEQSRPDRDMFVSINFGNIQAGFEHNFNVAGTPFGTFDYDSVMLYDRCAFSTCCAAGSTCNCPANCTTMDSLPPNQGQQNNMGQRDHLSAGDIAALQSIYSCTSISCPGNQTVNNDANQCGAVVNYPAPTTMGAGCSVNCSPASGSFFPVGTTTVNCDTIPALTCSFTVTVRDTQPPVITCPANITANNAAGLCGANLNYPAPTVSDNCGGLGAPVCLPASGSFFIVGTTPVSCTVADAAGNTAACSFMITVIDNEPPNIICPPTQNVLSQNGLCQAIVNYPAPVATDNCGVQSVVCVPASGSLFSMGTTPVTCTATDIHNNTAMCTFNVIVTCAKRPSGSEKGSLLIFSDVELRWNAAGALVQDTFVQLTNDNNQGLNVQMFFVNGDPPTAAIPAGQPGGPERAHPGWNNIDNAIYLTANQPSYWSVFTGQPGSPIPPPSTGPVSPFTVLDPGNPPGRPDIDSPTSSDRILRGFIIAFAINATGQEIKWNHLAGNATIVNYRDGAAWEYNAWAFQAVNPRLPDGAQIGTPGQLNLDGFEYARGFDQLLMNFQAVGATAFSGANSQVVSDTDLTLHLLTTDLRQNNTGPRRTKAKFDVWNQNEVKFSGAERCITCWEQRLLGQWAPLANHFIRPNLQTNVGKARIDGEFSPVVCGPAVGPPINGAFSILGVVSTRLLFDAGIAKADAGTNLFGMGFEAATIWYDILPPPPPATGDHNKPGDPSNNNADRNGEQAPESTTPIQHN